MQSIEHIKPSTGGLALGVGTLKIIVWILSKSPK